MHIWKLTACDQFFHSLSGQEPCFESKCRKDSEQSRCFRNVMLCTLQVQHLHHCIVTAKKGERRRQGRSAFGSRTQRQLFVCYVFLLLSTLESLSMATQILHRSSIFKRAFVVLEPRPLVSVILRVWADCQKGSSSMSQCLRAMSTMHVLSSPWVPLKGDGQRATAVIWLWLEAWVTAGQAGFTLGLTLNTAFKMSPDAIFSLFAPHCECGLGRYCLACSTRLLPEGGVVRGWQEGLDGFHPGAANMRVIGHSAGNAQQPGGIWEAAVRQIHWEKGRGVESLLYF